MLGGISGLVGTTLLGPRTGIFDKTTVSNLVKAASQKKAGKEGYYLDDDGKIRRRHNFINYSASQASLSSISSDQQMKDRSSSALDGRGKKGRNFRSFYNLDEETPMKYRLFLFRQ